MQNTTTECGLKELIYYLYRNTLLPDLYEVLGEEHTLKLAMVFGGMKIAIPSMKEINDLKRNIDIFETLSYSQSLETAKLLADKYEVTEVWVRAVYKKMHREYPRIVANMQAIKACPPVRVTTQRNPVHEQKNTQTKTLKITT